MRELFYLGLIYYKVNSSTSALTRQRSLQLVSNLEVIYEIRAPKPYIQSVEIYNNTLMLVLSYITPPTLNQIKSDKE